MVGLERSTVRAQIGRFRSEVYAMVRRIFRLGGREFRRRMMRERLSGPPGVYPKSGRLQRSFSYGTYARGGKILFSAQIGGAIAYYAEIHEASGALGFLRAYREEAAKMMDSLQSAFQLLAKHAALGGLSLGDAAGFAAPLGFEDSNDDALLQEEKSFKQRFSSGRRGFRNRATGFTQFKKFLEKPDMKDLAPHLLDAPQSRFIHRSRRMRRRA